MVLTNCWRCARVAPRALLLTNAALRPTTASIAPTASNLLRASQFSTSPAAFKDPIKKKGTTMGGSNAKAKGATTLHIKKRVVVKSVKHGVIGERRAQRKKLVLANTNATKVELPDLTANIATAENVVGRMFSFDGNTVDAMRAAGGFHLKQGWEFFYCPSTLVRKESIALGRLVAWVNGEEIKGRMRPRQVVQTVVDEESGKLYNVMNTVERMDTFEELLPGAHILTQKVATTPEAKSEESTPEITAESSTEAQNSAPPPREQVVAPAVELADESRSARVLIHGLRGSGKSVLLLQAMAWVYQRQWVVITIPNAQDLVIGHTEYEFDTNSNLWLQKVYVSALLRKMANLNADVLKKHKVSKKHTFRSDSVPEGSTLLQLVELGTVDPTYSWDIFTAVLHELELPGRPPVFFSLDNFGQITLLSEYRDTNHTLIHALDIALPATFVDYLTGKRAFWRGVTIAATSSACPATPALKHALAGDNPSPFKKIDPRILPIVQKTALLQPSPLSKTEAQALMEYYKESGLYAQDVDSTLSEKWVLSSGIPKELMAACKRVKC